MLEKLDDVIFSNYDIVFINTDSDHVTSFSNDMGLVNVYLNNVSFDDINFNDNDPETIIHVRIMTSCNQYKQCKAWKKDISKELMSVPWHLTRW